MHHQPTAAQQVDHHQKQSHHLRCSAPSANNYPDQLSQIT